LEGRPRLAGYRVHEVLFGQHHTAVGRTSKISGGIEISGTTVDAADFTVDLSSVKSDQTSRDAQFDGFIMETYEHPNARFHLTSPIPLAPLPSVGKTVTESATGQLTMRGVTRTVTFALSAERTDGAIDVDAEIPVIFSDWHIPNPSFAVAQVGKTGTIEVLLHLDPVS
jgi:polyisoprenoid-binding protein YceI